MRTRNMNQIDRACRLILGLVLLWVGFGVGWVSDNVVVQILVVGFAIVNVLSALASFCPVYYIANISTLRQSSNES